MTYPNRSDTRGALRAFAKERAGSVNTDLVSEQVNGVDRLVNLIRSEKSVLFYGSTGVGKTVQTIIAAAFLASQGKRRVLILTPNEAVRDRRWIEDLNLVKKISEAGVAGKVVPKWARTLDRVDWSIAELSKRPRPNSTSAELVLGTTPSLAGVATRSGGSSGKYRSKWLEALDPWLVVIDEAHVRTKEGTKTRAILSDLLDDHRLLTLTATPVSQRASGLQDIVTLNGHGTWSRDVTDYQRKVHSAVRRWWASDGDTDATQLAVDTALSARGPAREGFKTGVVRQQSTGEDPKPPTRCLVPVNTDWLQGYGLARILPALLGSAVDTISATDSVGVKPSDSYRRMLLSSPAAFWDSKVARVLQRRKGAKWIRLAREMGYLLGSSDSKAPGRQQLMHSKVQWTAERAVEEAADRQVLIFVQYLATVGALKVAIDTLETSTGVEVGVATDHAAVEHFRDNPRGGILIASPRHSMGLEFDQRHKAREKPRLLITHDLPWSAVSLQQQLGRLRRAANNFPEVLVQAPILDLPDDRRVWDTVMGRWSVSEIIDVDGGFAGDAIGVDSPGDFPSGWVEELRLQ